MFGVLVRDAGVSGGAEGWLLFSASHCAGKQNIASALVPFFLWYYQKAQLRWNWHALRLGSNTLKSSFPTL